MSRASTSNYLSQASLSGTSTPVPSNRSSIVEDMAVQTHRYLSTFEQHASAIRGNPDSELAAAYQRVIDEKRAQQPGTARKKLTGEERKKRQSVMEQILASPATTIDDHISVCNAAHTLLLMQQDVMMDLPYDVAREIDVRRNQLRSEQRHKKAMPQQEQFRPLVPSCTLPDFRRPSTNHLCHPVTAQAISDFLASPTSLVGQQFMLFPDSEDGFFYRVTSVEITLDGNKFGVQYEDVKSADIIDFDGMKFMLQGSSAVEIELPT